MAAHHADRLKERSGRVALQVILDGTNHQLLRNLGGPARAGPGQRAWDSSRTESPGFLGTGKALAHAELPTIFVLEGGDALDAVGPAVENVLEAFEQHAA